MKTTKSLSFLVLVAIFLVAPVVFAGDGSNIYWVSPTGRASWSDCESANSLSGVSACSLSTANANAVAGDTIYMRAGTYNTRINPGNSGTSVDSRIVYEAYDGNRTVIITNTTSGHGILWDNKDYIKIKGVVIDAFGGGLTGRAFQITNGSSYNEFAYCTFNGRGTDDGNKIWDGISYEIGGEPCVHNWFHHNIFARTGWIENCQDVDGWQLGVPRHDNHSGNTTFENNEWYGGGHHLLETFSRYNVIRNEFFHHEAWLDDPPGCDQHPPSARNGKYGNRNIQIYYEPTGPYQTVSDGDNGAYNLIEGIRTSNASMAIDGKQGGNIVLTSGKNIVRYNDSFYSETFGIYFKTGDIEARGVSNRVYNNTLYYNGQDSQFYGDGFGEGNEWRRGIVDMCDQGSCPDNIVMNNIIYGTYNNYDIFFKSSNTAVNNWLSTDSDPQFVDTTLSDPTSRTQPDFTLQPSSPVIDQGTSLTQANGAGAGSTTLIVDDALYFQDGTWGSALADHQADWIAIGTVGNVVQISSVNYDTNTITLTVPMSWSDNARIWLHKISDGTQVLHGAAPDLGAHERASSRCACDLNQDGVCDWEDWRLFSRDWGRTDCP